MFSGIVQAIGSIAGVQKHGDDMRARIAVADSERDRFDLTSVKLGDSIAVAGVCLTVVERNAPEFAVDVSVETLSCTTLASLVVGDRVNLEKALRLADRLDGHLVVGHVDGIGRVIAVEADARSQRWTFEAPSALSRYIAVKGSICVDGVSLTVNSIDVDRHRFGVNLIPHTIQATTFAQRTVGAAVNIEVDLIARYVERLRGQEKAL